MTQTDVVFLIVIVVLILVVGFALWIIDRRRRGRGHRGGG
jgi:hypothetical protein